MENNVVKIENRIVTTKKIKPSFSKLYTSLVIVMAILVLIFGINITKIDFVEKLMLSLKISIESSKPTEELFDDTGKVKLINVLFPEQYKQVSSAFLNIELKLDEYASITSNDGVLTLVKPNGLLYAPESGVVSVKNLSDGVSEIALCHNAGFSSFFSGHIGAGIRNGQYVQKGMPIALLCGDNIEFFITGNDEIITSLAFHEGELLWRE